MMEPVDENLFSVLSEAHDLARSNLVRALLNGAAALLVLCTVALADRAFIGAPGFLGSLSESAINALWASKWLFALGALLYMLWSLGHAYISWRHLREARYLWMRVDHG